MEENIGKVSRHWICQRFLGYNTKAIDNKQQQQHKLDFFKLKNSAKNTINRKKKHITEWAKFFSYHISDKGLILRIYKNSYNAKPNIT